MEKAEFLYMTEVLGDQDLSPGERWKSIRHITLDNNGNIYDIAKKVEDKEIDFVRATAKSPTSFRGLTGDVMGFVVVESLPVGEDVYKGETALGSSEKYVSFITIDRVQTVTFKNDTAREDIPLYITNNF